MKGIYHTGGVVLLSLFPFGAWLLSPASVVDLLLAFLYLPVLLIFGVRAAVKPAERRSYLVGLMIAFTCIICIVGDSLVLDRNVSMYVAGLQATGKCGPNYARLLRGQPRWTMHDGRYAVLRMNGIGANRVLVYKIEGSSSILRFGHYDSTNGMVRFPCIDQ